MSQTNPVSHDVIRRLMAQLPDTPEDALPELIRVLPAHFEHEEAPGGFFERMRELGRDPDAIDRLVADHAALRDELADPALKPGNPDRIEALAQHLRRHERAESRLEASSPVLSGEHDVPRRWGY